MKIVWYQAIDCLKAFGVLLTAFLKYFTKCEGSVNARSKAISEMVLSV